MPIICVETMSFLLPRKRPIVSGEPASSSRAHSISVHCGALRLALNENLSIRADDYPAKLQVLARNGSICADGYLATTPEHSQHRSLGRNCSAARHMVQSQTSLHSVPAVTPRLNRQRPLSHCGTHHLDRKIL